MAPPPPMSSSPVLAPALPAVTRSNSIRSTNSASSGASLRRRSRTRTRTLTKDSGRRGKSVGPPPEQPGENSADGANVTQNSGLSQPDVPPLPTRSPVPSSNPPPNQLSGGLQLRLPPKRERAWSTVHVRDIPPEAGRGRIPKPEGSSTSKAKTRARGMSLPRSAFRPATASSDESSIASPRTPTGPFDAPFVRVRNGNSQHFRDSIVSSSTSLYPPSTSTDSDVDSSLLTRSPKKRGHDFGPDVMVHNGQADFDVDDVSYRLRLLVNNSYFLPPAHSKPSPLSLAPPKPSQEQKPAKPSTPAFLDFFRMGKSKSKPTTPLAQTPPAVDAPILRTTSDSTTASGYAPRPQSHSTPQTPLKQPFSSFQQPQASRVVVLRERMDDLMEAAKQVERDMKLRTDGRKAKSQGTVQGNDAFDDVIDPTDIVDLPPPPAAYPFAVQASVLHGLGPGESLGADLLADRLPPGSPGMWSMSTEELLWRKAILQEAVSLSMTESPETSYSSMSPSLRGHDPQSPSFRSEFSGKSPEPASPPTPKAALIGQRIIEPAKMSNDKVETRTLSPLSALLALHPTSPILGSISPSFEVRSFSNLSSLAPHRAETPAASMPLTPPPFRRHSSHPQFSMSVSDVTRPPTAEGEAGRDSLNTLRKVVSSPQISALHDEHRDAAAGPSPLESIEQRLNMLSPPVPAAAGLPPMPTRPSTSMRGTPFSDDDSLSYATPMDGDIDDDQPRPSMTLSLPSIGRPSMSECSNASPTVSAFEDAVFGSCRSPSPLLFRRSYMGAIGAPPSPATSTRPNVLSPPPRPSSSVDATTLPPPPRSPAVKPVYRPSTSSGRSSQSTDPLHTAVEGPDSEVDPEFSPATIVQQAYSPPLSSPPLSLSERRGRQSGLSLLIPPEFISPSIHSAPAPASPTAFFDRIQSHPNAMDDLETSDESDAESMAGPALAPSPAPTPPPAEAFGEPSARASFASSRSSRSARPSFMRLGNHSTPHLTPTDSPENRFPSFDVPDRRLPIGHIAPRNAPGAARAWKKAKGAVPPLPRRDSEDLPGPSVRPAVARRPATSSGASASASASSGGEERARRFQRESLQKFDGMLLSHIASERDRIRRITTNLSSTARQAD